MNKSHLNPINFMFVLLFVSSCSHVMVWKIEDIVALGVAGAILLLFVLNKFIDLIKSTICKIRTVKIKKSDLNVLRI